MNLESYCNTLAEYKKSQPVSAAYPPIKGINTLWVPLWSGKRTATLNLNHGVPNYDTKTGMAYGENGNCQTPYVIIEVPEWFTDRHVEIVAELLCKEMNKPAGYPTIRVLKAERIAAIKRIIGTLQPETITQ